MKSWWATRQDRAHVPTSDSIQSPATRSRPTALRIGAVAMAATMAAGAVLAGLAAAQAPAPAKPAAPPPVLDIPDAPKPRSAEAWLVMDHATGRVLAARTSTSAWSRPASPRS